MAIESKFRTGGEAAVRRFWPQFTPFSLPIEGSNSGSVSFAPVSLKVSGKNFSGINQVLVALASHLDANQ